MLSKAHIEGWMAEVDAAGRPVKCAKEYAFATTALELYKRLEAAEDTIGGLRDALDSRRQSHEETLKRLEAAEGAVAGLRGALEKTYRLLDNRQWQDVAEGRWAYCQSCGHESCNHEPDCPLALSLAEAEHVLASTPDPLAPYRAVYEAAKRSRNMQWFDDGTGWHTHHGASSATCELCAALAACERGER
jgi:hypothetical protein